MLTSSKITAWNKTLMQYAREFGTQSTLYKSVLSKATIELGQQPTRQHTKSIYKGSKKVGSYTFAQFSTSAAAVAKVPKTAYTPKQAKVQGIQDAIADYKDIVSETQSIVNEIYNLHIDLDYEPDFLASAFNEITPHREHRQELIEKIAQIKKERGDPLLSERERMSEQDILRGQGINAIL